MKNFRILTVIIALSIGVLELLPAQGTTTVTDASSLLWKLEKEGQATSYLYGTIHLISKDHFFVTDATRDALEACEQLALEIDMDDPGLQMELMQYVQMMDGVTLTQLLSEEQYAQVNALVQQALGVGLEPFNNWQPIMVGSLYLSLFLEGEAASYEQYLMEQATAQGKEVVGLETPAEAMGVMNSIAYEDQVDILLQVTDVEEGKALFRKMAEVYTQQDIDAMYTLITESNGGDALSEALVDQRNLNWVDDINRLAADQATFFAVGCGHLAGEKGVLELLREEGYTVTAVR